MAHLLLADVPRLQITPPVALCIAMVNETAYFQPVRLAVTATLHVTQLTAPGL
jgi:hypothetical protein